jgi:hypothetical protein
MKRGLGWPIGITAMLGLTVAANLWILRVAGADPSFAIEPDYYARAVRWDSTQAQAGINRALAWRLAPRVSSFRAGIGGLLAVELRDSANALIDDASVDVSAFAVARSNLVATATLAHAGPGTFAARLPLEHGGAWELRFDVRRGVEHFTSTQRLDVRTAGPPPVAAP